MIDLGIVKVDWTVNAGQLLVSGALMAVGWGLRRSYKFAVHASARITAFLERIQDNDELLQATTTVVDDHTQALLKADLLSGPVVVLARRRRSGDPAVFTKDNA